MTRERKLKFNSNNCLVFCSTGWETDKYGCKGVWCTANNGKKYFIRKGESVLDARQRIENINIDKYVMQKYSTVIHQVERIGYAITNVNDGMQEYVVKIIKSDDDFVYEILKRWYIDE